MTGLSLALLAVVTASDPQAPWPQHRGPGGRGIAGSKAPLPVLFNAREGHVWKTAVPAGKSSPILASGRLFLTAHDGKKLLTLCFDAQTGAELWRREVEKTREEVRNRLNDPAAPTPVTDGRAVYAFFADFGLVAYSLGGDELWRMPLGPFESEHGMAAWPALGSDSLFVVADVSNGAFLAAFDKKNGKERWRVMRRSTVGAYASPIVHKAEGAAEVVITSGPFEMAAYDAATGERVWWVTGLPFQPKSAPVVIGDTVYMNSLGIDLPWPDFAGLLKQYDKDGNGTLSAEETEKFGYIKFNFSRLDENKNGQLEKLEWDPIVRGMNATLAVRIQGKGDQTGNILWRYGKALPDVPQPLVADGVVYNIRDGGILTSLDAATGRVLKQGRLRGAIDQYFASPVAGDGKVYVSSAAGTLTVVRAGGDWEILSTNDLEEPLWATPAIAGSNMYIRAGNSLYCFRGDGQQKISAAPVTADLSGLAGFTGTYRIRPGNEISIAIEDGTFLLKYFRTETELVRTGQFTFKSKQTSPYLLTFAEEGGQVQSVMLEFQGRSQRFLRVR